MRYFPEIMILVLASLRFILCTIFLLQFHYVCKNFQQNARSRALVVEALILILYFSNEIFSG